MHELVMPQPAPCRRIEREQTIGEEVCAFAIAAPEIKGCRPCGQKDDAAPRVYADAAPRIRAADALPRIFRPRVIAVFAGPRNRMKYPANLARAHIVSPYVSGCGQPRPFVDAR